MTPLSTDGMFLVLFVDQGWDQNIPFSSRKSCLTPLVPTGLRLLRLPNQLLLPVVDRLLWSPLPPPTDQTKLMYFICPSPWGFAWVLKITVDSIYQGCWALQSNSPFDHWVDYQIGGGWNVYTRLYFLFNMRISALAYIKHSLVVFDPWDQNLMFNLCIYPLEKSLEADFFSSSHLFKDPN